MSSFSSQPVSVDDRDPQLVYSPPSAWSQSGKAGAEFDGTTTFTTQANATVTFHFNGTSCTVFGSVGMNTTSEFSSTIPPRSSYVVDNRSPNEITMPLQGMPQRGILFFTVSSLELDTHSLVITTLAPGGFFYLDRIEIDGGTNSSTSQTHDNLPGPTATTKKIPSTSAKTRVASSTSSSDSSNPVLSSSQESDARSISKATIVGIVFGVLGLLFLVGVIFASRKYYKKRHPKRKKKPKFSDIIEDSYVKPPKVMYDVEIGTFKD